MSSSLSAIGASSLLQLYLAQSITEERQPLQKKQENLDILESRKETLNKLDQKLGGLDNVINTFKSAHSSPFHALSKVSEEKSAAFGVDASISATPGNFSAEVLRLASSDTRVSKIYDPNGSELQSFFSSNGSQTFSINVASPTLEDAGNRVDVNVTVNPTSSTNRSILSKIAQGINGAMSSAVTAGSITEKEAAVASVVTESEGNVRLQIRSGQTGFTHRLDLSDSADDLLKTIEINKNAVIDGERTENTPASLTGSTVSGPFVVDASNNTLDIDVNGTTVSATLTAGTYASLADLATEVETQIGSEVTVAASGGALTITTVDSGASTSLEVTGGTALELLGLGTNAESASFTGDVISGPITISKDNQFIEINVDGADISARISKATYATLDDLAAEVEGAIGSDKVAVSVENSALKIETVSAGASSSLQIKGGEALDSLGFRSLVSSATLTGDPISGSVTIITNFNDQLRVEIDGSRKNVRIAGGTYSDLNDIADEIESDIGSDLVSVTVDGNSLKFETVNGGSEASIQIVGGDTASSLGLTIMSDPVTGTDMTAVTGVAADPIDPAAGTDLSLSDNIGEFSAIADYESGGMLKEIGTDAGNSLLNGAIDLDGIIYTSDTNQVDDIIDGVTITLNRTSETSEDFSIERDVETFIDEIESFVSSYNDALAFIKEETNELSSSGIREDSLLRFRYDTFRRQLREDLAYSVNTVPTEFKRLTDIGFSVEYDGTLALTDEAALARALNDDPEAVRNLLDSEDGVLTRLKGRIDDFTSNRGVLDDSRSRFASQITTVKTEISSVENHLEDREKQLRREYNLLENRLTFFETQQQSLYQLLFNEPFQGL